MYNYNFPSFPHALVVVDFVGNLIPFAWMWYLEYQHMLRNMRSIFETLGVLPSPPPPANHLNERTMAGARACGRAGVATHITQRFLQHRAPSRRRWPRQL